MTLPLTVSTIVEREHSFLIGARASIVDANDRMQAWAEKHVRTDSDIRWILGNFIETDAANDNGHIFPLDDIKQTQASIQYKPLNMLHHGNYIVGCFAASELLGPPEGEAAGDTGSTGTVEALSAFWRNLFPEEYALVEAAHNEGALYYSMECVPKSLTCPDPGCGLTADYQGRTHQSYCAHMNAMRGPKRLNMPHFNAGALIIPPVRPGWKGADVKELSALINRNADVAEQVYAGLEQTMPHLDPEQWEAMMAEIMAEAESDPTLPIPELVTAKSKPAARTIAAGQIDKKDVHYGPSSPDRDPDSDDDNDDDDATDPDRCGTCTHGVFVMDADGNVTASMCDLVAGPIKQSDVCDLYSEVPERVRTETWPSYGNPSDALEVAALREYARKFTVDQRKKLAKEGKAKKDGSFPIENEQDLKNAIKLAKPEDRAHVKKRAKALGKSDLIPDSWG